MSIPESQFETWSHQGSITQSAATYNTVKRALEADGTPYHGRDISVFLQGSYGNDTNIFAESDVDVVCVLNGCIQSDLTKLSEGERNAYDRAYADATYSHVDFKRDVLGVLRGQFGSGVVAGDKAIFIPAGGARRNADVIVAIQFRRYYKFNGIFDQSYDEGICFFDSSGQRIANYPKQHSANLTTKHQATSQWFKPMARILKNLRGCLVDRELLEEGVAPSYYLEGLLYNVPNDRFGKSYQDTFVNAINWLAQCDRAKLVCANEQYFLLHDTSPVTWRAEKCAKFLDAASRLYRDW
ncbi:MAG: nucleotidyltransferase [Phycisphaerales bacterium]